MTSSESRNISPGTLTESTKAGEERAQFYLKKHKILELLENITSALVYERPGECNSLKFVIFLSCGKIGWGSLLAAKQGAALDLILKSMRLFI